jgi:hypothetical protein
MGFPLYKLFKKTPKTVEPPSKNNGDPHWISAREFKDAVALDPKWAEKIKSKVIIKDYCDLSNSSIEKLSPFLSFQGDNGTGQCATFRGCQKLKKAEGTFFGFVSFTDSAIEEIGGLKIPRADNIGNAISFSGCRNLKTVKGDFPGCVDLSNSGVESVGPVKISDGCRGVKLDVSGCKKLRSIFGNFKESEVTKDKDTSKEKIVEETIEKVNKKLNNDSSIEI